MKWCFVSSISGYLIYFSSFSPHVLASQWKMQPLRHWIEANLFCWQLINLQSKKATPVVSSKIVFYCCKTNCIYDTSISLPLSHILHDKCVWVQTQPCLSLSPPGTTVMTMTAFDADDPATDNAALRYTIVRQSPDKPSSKMFYIDAERGDIVTAISPMLLDREVGWLG